MILPSLTVCVRTLLAALLATATAMILVLALVPAPPASAESTNGLPWLKTSGNRIVVAATGQDVILRGANVLRSEWNLTMNTDRRSIPALAGDWKGNIIMRGFASDPVLTGDAKYLAMLDEHVSLAASNRMYVQFAWRSHEINGAQPTMPDDRAQRALALLAQRYHGISHVMYGLQVEPHDVSWATLHPKYVSMVDAIRAAAAPYKPIIMAPGTNWGRDVSGAIMQPVLRDNIVYKSHPYNGQSSFQKQFVDTYNSGKPVFIGEFGLSSTLGMHLADVEALMALAEKLGLGWTAWCFDYQGGPALVTDNTTFAPTDPYGAVVKREMLKTPPVPTTVVMVPDTTAPTVAITSPTSGSTVSGSVHVDATVTDDVGVSRVEFIVDGVLAATVSAAPYRFTWNTSTVANGQHSLVARALDAANNSTATLQHTVNVQNQQYNWAQINDNVFSYTGIWSGRTATGLFRGDGHVTSAAGATSTLTFNGRGARLYSTRSPKGGKLAVSVDGGPETVVDLYARSTSHQVVVLETPTLSEATHTLRVRATGTKHRKSKGAEVVADRIDVLRPISG